MPRRLGAACTHPAEPESSPGTDVVTPYGLRPHQGRAGAAAPRRPGAAGDCDARKSRASLLTC
jgi:hypothetical protein